MSTLAQQMRDRLAMPPPPPPSTTLPAVPPSSASASGGKRSAPTSELAAQPANKRQRQQPTAAPPVDEHTVHANFEGAIAPDVAYRDSMNREMERRRREMASRSYHCLFCEFGDSVVTPIVGGWAVGYKKMIDYIHERYGTVALMSLANEVVRIFNHDIWEPTVRELGHEPDYLYPLTVEDVIRHLREHTHHPLVMTIDNLDCMREQVAILRDNLCPSPNIVDKEIARELRQSVLAFQALIDKVAPILPKNSELIFDPAKVTALAATERLQRLSLKNTDALGGASANGSTASTLASAQLNMRPTFGYSELRETDNTMHM